MPEGLLQVLTAGLVCTCLTLFPALFSVRTGALEGQQPGQVLHLVLQEMFQKQEAFPTQPLARGEAGKVAEVKPRLSWLTSWVGVLLG